MPLPANAPAGMRHARPADLDALHAIEVAAHAHPTTRSKLAHEFSVPASTLWCIEREDEVRAFLCFWLLHDELHIIDIAVHPAAQRQGLATALLGALIAHASAQELYCVTLEVRASNAPAIALYERLGLAQVGRRTGYYEQGDEDALIMTRRL